jgi:hypothetical protein
MSTAARSFLMIVTDTAAALDLARRPLRFPPYLPERQPILTGNGTGTG